MEAVVQVLSALSEHSGKETGIVKSLKLAVGDVDERVSEKKVLKQGRLPVNSLLRSTPISRNSPVRYAPTTPTLSEKVQPPVATVAGVRTIVLLPPFMTTLCVNALLTSPHRSLPAAARSHGAGDRVAS